ncbi:hypothetical protein LTR10_020556 [Elasticomyces elasticus]|uniref:Uncharacterized protein n=1 Tax=Exophiala sideris TaxID=1016849 RepID=A0ABR0JKL8_9EURO|nr:hypothetical protein LTR10_020556 [Elasticomyces elasticus]KAK5035410.1 hypothetical protein LTS07_002847 [Exophiala sideris]KAK5039239.1 hypothetical protein LTR13_003495 [Exophiala sideris]KAK5066334.1 hypothetical protein LTR69_002853 [Exophiala sideris]KAK5187011.1 hypothetical protein LTR44_001018 [Eurotiomycetes sp. CCFEE 6388]
MVVADSTVDLLRTLTTALESASSAFPEDQQQFLPPTEGISLLDVKNDLLLSYLQNLAFLTILKLRNGGDIEKSEMGSEVVKKLVELRVYLERGVRPLENKLKYQIDKVTRAADDAERRAAQRSNDAPAVSEKSTTKSANQGSDISDVDSEEEDDDDTEQLTGHMNEDISAAPRPAALLRNQAASKKDTASTKSRATATGAYKPPRITPTSMPESASNRTNDQPARKRRSQLLDEYIDEELSTAPRAQPSIGSNSTIVKHGRGTMSSRDREKERERTDYEERNFVRLPAISKAEKRKARLSGESNRRDLFGGEDWTGLGGLGDRINRTVAGKARGEGGSVLERREKRRRDTQDGPRGDGAAMGDSFEKRRKILQGRAEKKGRRK